MITDPFRITLRTIESDNYPVLHVPIRLMEQNFRNLFKIGDPLLNNLTKTYCYKPQNYYLVPRIVCAALTIFCFGDTRLTWANKIDKRKR
jgi:hypothetical protein